MAAAKIPEIFEIKVKQATDFSKQKQDLKDELPVYKTTSKNRGLVKIINIENIPGFDSRCGSEHDVTNLDKLFTQIGFSVDIHPTTANSHTKQGIEEALENFVMNKKLETADIAVLIIMSHGSREKFRDFFYTEDNQKIFYDDVKRYFRNEKCKFMQHKPKIIIFQMCRGTDVDCGTSSKSPPNLQFDGNLESNRIPNVTDLLVAYATTPDAVACRWSDRGSLFVMKLCEEFMNYSHTRDVECMLKVVYRKMSDCRIERETKDGKQVIMQAGECLSSTFSRCYLNPGIYLDDNKVIREISTDKELNNDLNKLLEESMDLTDSTKRKEMSTTAKDQNGNTSLHLAANWGDLKTCLQLIQNGALVNDTNNEGFSALHFAALQNHSELYAELIKAGADPLLPNHNNETPTDYLNFHKSC